MEKDTASHLEPEWAAVILVALVYNGDITLNVDGRETLDAGTVDRAATLALTDLCNFRFFGRPKTLPLNLWGMVFEGLGLPAGTIRDENTRDQAVRQLQSTAQAELERTAAVSGRLTQGLAVWNERVFTGGLTYATDEGILVGSTEPDAPISRLSLTDFTPHLRGYKQLLEELARYNTVGKLRNLRWSGGQIADALGDRKWVQRATELLDLVGQLQPTMAYLAEAARCNRASKMQ